MHFLCLGVAQLVACYLGVVEAARSSRVTQTKEKPRSFGRNPEAAWFCFFSKMLVVQKLTKKQGNTKKHPQFFPGMFFRACYSSRYAIESV